MMTQVDSARNPLTGALGLTPALPAQTQNDRVTIEWNDGRFSRSIDLAPKIGPFDPSNALMKHWKDWPRWRVSERFHVMLDRLATGKISPAQARREIEAVYTLGRMAGRISAAPVDEVWKRIDGDFKPFRRAAG